tara:strand:- start:183 stop:764 length:582 start_codon:yes stop_codon:yes gene_type:complete
MIWISESFDSVQGTGHLLGVRQLFVRFAGCGVKCPIRSECDEQGSLSRRGAIECTIESLVEEALASGTGWMHITGGEPTDQSEGLQELTMLARERGLKVHIQSSGVRHVPCQWDWLTISPKTDPVMQAFGQECIVVDDGTWTVDRLKILRDSTKFWCYYLVPLSGADPASTVDLASRAGWDMTIQAHKHWGVR